MRGRSVTLPPPPPTLLSSPCAATGAPMCAAAPPTTTATSRATTSAATIRMARARAAAPARSDAVVSCCSCRRRDHHHLAGGVAARRLLVVCVDGAAVGSVVCQPALDHYGHRACQSGAAGALSLLDKGSMRVGGVKGPLHSVATVREVRVADGCVCFCSDGTIHRRPVG